MSKEDVIAIKQELVLRGVNLSGPCGAFEITKRVAWKLRAEGVGLVAKDGGNNCQGYSTDLVQYKDGSLWVDILGDGGGENKPMWITHTDTTPSVWRAAIDPGDPIVPVPPPATVRKTLADFFAAGAMIRSLYMQELGRDVTADPAAEVNWLYHWREDGRDATWIRDRIRESAEWKAHHDG